MFVALRPLFWLPQCRLARSIALPPAVAFARPPVTLYITSQNYTGLRQDSTETHAYAALRGARA